MSEWNIESSESSLYTPSFVSDWQRTSLVSMAKWTNGIAFRSIQFSSLGRPVIKIAELKNGITAQTKFTRQAFHGSVFVQRGDMLFSWSGQPETSIDVFRWNGIDGWLNQHIFRVETNDEHNDGWFYYLLRYLKPVFIRIARNKQTTGLGHITKTDLSNITIACPPLHEQKAIAHILGSLDDKIDQLRKTNSVLEDMASALFKSWFVDFDPVKAKQENRPTGLPPELDALFPDSFEDSSVGLIPKGWRVAGLASTGEFLNGLALQKYPGDVLPVIKIPQLRQNSSEGADRCSNGVAPQYVIDDGDLLFSWSGTLVAGWWTAGKGALNQHLFKVSSGELSTVMLKHWIDHHLPWFRLVASSKAVTMGHIKRGHLDEAKVVIPVPTLKEYADSILADYRDKYITNGKQIRTLTNLRDTLLPKLISGELRVPDAEAMVAELGL